MSSNKQAIRCVWRQDLGLRLSLIWWTAASLLSATAAAAAEAKVQVPSRVPVPEENALHRAEATVRQLYKQDFAEAEDEPQKRALARKLLQAALLIKDNPTDRFAILRMSRDLSKNAADVNTAFASIDEMAKSFDVNPLEMKAYVIASVARRASSPAQCRFIVDRCISLADAAVAVDDHAVARGLVETARSVSKKDRELARRVDSRSQQVQAAAEAFEPVRLAMGRLKEDPSDPEANCIVGKHLCLMRADWNRGLPMLKRGQDPNLKCLAEQDLANPSVPQEQVCTANAWRQLAATCNGVAKANIFARAAFWYAKAVSKLTGLEKAEIQQQLDQCEFAAYDLDAAIEAGMDWLAAQQQDDGGWTFGSTPDSGKWSSRVAATGLALLPFVEAGNTHVQGEYRMVVRKGLLFVTSRMKLDPKCGGDLRDVDESSGMNGMTAHALASLAICETYARSRDKRLQNTAQLAVNFLVNAQGPKDGGWYTVPRYSKNRTAYLGWPLMVFTTVPKERLAVPPQTAAGISMFLDRVQANDGRTYGNSGPTEVEPLYTAMGLLGRVYLGEAKAPVVKEGIAQLAALSNVNDVQLGFFSAYLLSRTNRELWEKRRPSVFCDLLRRQEKDGPVKGSWFKDVSTSAPLSRSEIGRIGTTALCLLTLAVGR